jgi:hypothetical protein
MEGDEVMFEAYMSMPTTIMAVRFTDESKDRVFNSLTGVVADFEDGDPVLKVTTVYGEEAIVRLGDWIVKEAEPGRYYPVKNDVFKVKYRRRVQGQVQTLDKERRSGQMKEGDA